MTTVADKLPPTPSKFCGTKGGWRSHSLRKQNPCDECRKFSAKTHRKASRFHKFKGQAMTKEQRWGEIIVTHTTPTKPDVVLAKRVVVKPRKRRKELTQTGTILDSVKSWDQLSDRTKNRMLSEAKSKK